MPHWIRAFTQTTTWLGGVMIATIWGAVYYLTNETHQRAYEDGLRQGSNLAYVFEEYVSRVIRGTDSELLVLRKLYEQDGASFDFAGWIASAGVRDELTVHLSITGPDGVIRL